MASKEKSSRLQKLLQLLESGSSEDVRKAAAKQVVDITKAHPQQLPAVVRKVHACLYHKQWDARIAAGEAFGLLAEAFHHHSANELVQAAKATGSNTVNIHQQPLSTALQNFNINTLLEKGTSLLASGGQEFDLVHDPNLTAKQRLQKQKEALKKSLGFDAVPEGVVDTDELLNDEDVDMQVAGPRSASGPSKQAATELLLDMEGLSARERNRLKRKAKALARTDSLRSSDSAGPARMGAIRQSSLLASQPSLLGNTSGDLAAAARTDEEEWQEVSRGAWPLQWAADQMLVDVLDPCWEVRHGAAVGLRELLRSHAGGLGVTAPVADDCSGWMLPNGTGKRRLLPVTGDMAGAAVAANQAWLEECILLLLCVLALDQFADYGSDQVTAPVRETAAQALAMALGPVPQDTVGVVVTILEQLQGKAEWAVRYGGYLGVKYLMASRRDLVQTLLPRQLPLLKTGLQDPDDDVIAASAAALLPMVPSMQPQDATHIIQLLWTQLEHLDWLSPASASCLQLLAQMYSVSSMCRISEQLGLLVPLLLPYMHHTLTSVRTSTAKCLQLLLQASIDQNATGWFAGCASILIHAVFLRLLVESDPKVLEHWSGVWVAALDACSGTLLPTCMRAPLPSATGVQSSPSDSLLVILFKLASTPAGRPLPAEYLNVPAGVQTSPRANAAAAAKSMAAKVDTPVAKRQKTRMSTATNATAASKPAGQDTVESSAISRFTVGSHGEGSAVRMRLLAARSLSALLARLSQQDPSLAQGQLCSCLTAESATTRQLAALTLWSWVGTLDASSRVATAPCMAPGLQAALQRQLWVGEPPAPPNPCQPLQPTSTQPYEEVRASYSQLYREVHALLASCMQAGWMIHTPGNLPVESLSTDHVAAMLKLVPSSDTSPGVAAALQRCMTLTTSLQTYETYLHMTTLAVYSAALVQCGNLPPKLNLVLQPLMAALKKEPEQQLQGVCAQAIALVLQQCSAKPELRNAVTKLTGNLCRMACGDPGEVPSVTATTLTSTTNGNGQHKVNVLNNTGNEKDSTAAAINALSAVDISNAATSAEAQAYRIARLGAEAALVAACSVFNTALWEQLSALYQFIAVPLSIAQQAVDAKQLQDVVNALQVLRVVGPNVISSLVPTLEAFFPQIFACSGISNDAVRLSAARCISALANAWLETLMPAVLRMLIPRFSSEDAATRLGAVTVVVQLVSTVGNRLAPYVVLLVVPLLRCMSDAHEDVRKAASSCFGTLVALVPLVQGQPLPPGLDDAQLKTAQQDSTFLIQLLDNKKAEDYSLPVSPNVTLRPYQQEGVNWLAFLKRFGLHGVLADDMGLGKTLQASCILAAALTEQHQGLRLLASQQPAAVTSIQLPVACLVICPTTLVQHWVHEINRFMDPTVLRPYAYSGGPGERQSHQRQLDKQFSITVNSLVQPNTTVLTGTQLPSNVVIVSYEHVRADSDWFAAHPWLYAVLDEGHMIKSHKSKIAQACRRLPAKHRLILSGTPIQNSVIELWSLFDFLMPGFLGSEKDFNAKYGKALRSARYSKKGSAEAEAGLIAVDALHKQVMPFVLRRTKAQVLQDLPPKIIQDIYCDMSPLQAALYEDFQGSEASQEATAALQSNVNAPGSEVSKHVFTSLHYLRQLCSHPAMVMNLQSPQHRDVASRLLTPGQHLTQTTAETALRDISHAPKLVALRELMQQCGIINGGDASDANNSEDDMSGLSGGGGAGHRLLVFAQLKTMLDLVERDVLQPAGVNFLRLDGSVEQSQRFNIVQRFNSDPTIDVLLLTTAVGGLGLNLTSADTVVFLEHDWNPMKDLQAMDRAHRLGQTRTVNVYRLLMRNTLEERVMGLQQFKLDVANTVVNQENMSMTEMDTGQLLDLFGNGAGQPQQDKKPTGTGLAAMLQSMGDLEDDAQYAQQFDMQSFVKKLAKKT